MTIFDRGTYETDKWRADEIGGDLPRRAHHRPLRLLPDRRRRLDGPPDGPARAGLGADARGGRTHARCRGRRPAGRRRRLGVRDGLGRPARRWRTSRVAAYASATPTAATSPRGIRRSGPLGPALAPIEAVLDGEIVAFDGPRPDAALLERRKAPKDAGCGPARGRADAGAVPGLRPALAGGALARSSWSATPSAGSCWTGWRWPATTGRRRPTSPAAASSRSRPPAPRAWPAWSRSGWTSPYLPGRRSRLWRTIGHVRRRLEFSSGRPDRWVVSTARRTSSPCPGPRADRFPSSQGFSRRPRRKGCLDRCSHRALPTTPR